MKNTVVTILLILMGAASGAQPVVGQMATEISLPDARDHIVNLSSFKGRVVLVDFWASWCRPCRAAIPGLIRLYNKYKSQGFVVFGVSIDSRKDMWLSAVSHDKIKYTQVNDNGGWNSSTGAAYAVSEIPTTFLLDKNGKIIAIDPDMRGLEMKIKQLLQ